MDQQGDKRNMIEKILCSAVWYDDGEFYPHSPRNIRTGLVIGGLRHCNCITVMAALLGNRASRMRKAKEIQGFLTTHGRFLNRYGAYDLAVKVKQLKEPKGKIRETPPQLYSEDLW